MKTGDLIKFKAHTNKSGPVGIIICMNDVSAEICWACPYTSEGFYRFNILEVINENR
jgi:hypothetical protein